MRILLAVIALLAAIYGAGWFKTTEVVTEIEIDAAPDAVWDVLVDFDGYPEWNPFILEISGLPEQGERLTAYIEPLHQDGGMTFSPTVLVSNSGQEFRWLGQLGIPAIMDGEHYFVLEETENGTRLIHGERFRGVLDFVMDMQPLAQSFDAMNRALKTRVEGFPSVSGFVDRHLHLHSAEMGAAMSQFCGTLAPCDAEQVSQPVTLSGAMEMLQDGGFDHGVVLSLAYMSGMPELDIPLDDAIALTRNENEFTANQVDESEGYLSGYMSVNPLAPYAVEEIQYWIDDGRLAGLKLHFANSAVDLLNEEHRSALNAILRTAESGGLTTLIHMRTRNPEYGAADVHQLLEILEDLPELDVIIAHFGGWGGFDAPTESAMNAFQEALEENNLPRLRFDTSAVLLPGLPADRIAAFTESARRIGVERLVFGSDWDGQVFTPFDSAGSVNAILEAGFSAEELDQMRSQ
jgi:predicted TIM-barrel fold metal-dependent hydrolase